MAFAKLEDDSPNTSSRKTNYLKIVPGVPTVIRILDDHPVKVFKHWVRDGAGRMVGVRCLGPSDCPICQRNAQLGFNRDHPDYIPSRKRYRVNVVDLTPVKRCPKCGAAYAATAAPSLCSVDGCGGNLSNVQPEPLDEVKILERGPQLMGQFNALEMAPHPMTGEHMPIQAYPIMLVATGKGKDMVITVVPQMIKDITHEYEPFDLDGGLVLTAEEVTYLLEGGNFSDILEERRASFEASGSDTEGHTEDSAPRERIPF